MTELLQKIDWASVRTQYKARRSIHKKLLRLLEKNEATPFVRLGLGISDPIGNYSAEEHQLGPKILASNLNAERSVVKLAKNFLTLEDGQEAPDIIKAANIKYLQIGVGSELSALMNPKYCWVANTRTIWTHLLFKHGGQLARANEELKLYRNADDTSEMAYRKWKAIHRELGPSLRNIASLARPISSAADVKPGKWDLLWADALCNRLYEQGQA